jgi:predicted permease
MRTIWQDVRYGLRMLGRSPGFTAVVVLLLALGIGANTVFFSVVNAVLLRPLPFRDPDRLVVMLQRDPAQGSVMTVSPAAFALWRQRNPVFERVTTGVRTGLMLTGTGETEILQGGYVYHAFFETLGIQPALGRSFLPEEEEPGKNGVAILSHGLWQRRFGGTRDVIGKTVGVNGTQLSIIGVMPSGFTYPLMKGVDLWAPLPLTAGDKGNFGGHWLQVIGRLKNGVTIEQANAAMDVLASQIAQEFPEGNEGLTAVRLWPLHQFVVAGADRLLWTLFAAVGCVLLIACANVAGLLLARLPTRRGELAVRMALGAGVGRIARLLLTESILQVLLAGSLGLLLSVWGIRFARAWIPAGFPLVENVSIDGRMLLFAVAVLVLIGVSLGVAPVWQIRGSALTESLKTEAARVVGGGQGHRLRAALVVFEMGAAAVLLTGGGLMIRSLANRMTAVTGFEPDRLLTMGIHFPPYGYSRPQSTAVFHQLLGRLEALPSVRSAAGVTYLPTEAGSRWSAVSDEAAARDGEGPQAAYRAATPGYFRTMGIPLLKGRDFAERDVPGQPEVAIINDRLARHCWPNEDPIGRLLKPGGPKSEHPWLTVVGVVENTENSAHDPQTGSYELEMYRPLNQHPSVGARLVVRTEGDPLTVVHDIRSQVVEVNPDIAVSSVRTARQILSEGLSGYRVITVLPGMFAAAALLLAAVGLYGTIHHSVSQRQHEIGIRMALGAGIGPVLRMVMRQGLKMVLVGLAAGLIVARAVVHVVSPYLYQVAPTDPATFAAVALLFIAVAALACYIPARRAAGINPMAALRHG